MDILTTEFPTLLEIIENKSIYVKEATPENLSVIFDQFCSEPTPNFFLQTEKSNLLTAIVHRVGLKHLPSELELIHNQTENSQNIKSNMSSLTELISNTFAKNNLNINDISESIAKLSPAVTSGDIAELIQSLSHNLNWDAKLLGAAFRNLKISNISWDEVLRLIEYPPQNGDTSLKLNLGSSFALESILNFLAVAGDGLILKFYSKKWLNAELQVDLLNASASINSEVFDLKQHGLSQVVDLHDYMNAPPHIKEVANSLVHQPLNFSCLIQYSLDALSQDDAKLVNATAFLDRHAKAVPELFFLGGVSMKKPWPELLERVIYNFFDLFLMGNASSALVFYRLAMIDKEFFIHALVQSFTRDPLLVNRIFAIAQEARILSDILNSKHYSLALEIAAIADKQDLLLFGSYLKENSKYKIHDFVRSLLDFLELKATLEYTQNQSTNTPPSLNLRSVAAALQLLNAVEIPPERVEQYKAIQIQCLQSYPRLINFGQGYDLAILSHTGSNSFSADVEREMKLYYQQMYEQQIEIRDIITMLQRLKQSSDPHEQDVFACMVHSLFDEYRFFPEYPLNALATTAVLFGSLVYFQLIDGMPLSIALRFILDSLRQPLDSNMFKFGLQALFEFRERLPEFPKYCHILLEIPGLAMHQQFFQQIKEIVGGGTEGKQNAIVYTSINVDMSIPDEAIQEDPKEGIRDKVLFLVNNVAQNNLQSKTKELISILDKKYYRWFATYIVGQRAKLEPNYHSLYINLLQIVGSKSLELHFIKVTYHQIVKLINAPDTATTPEKRNLLKNLGQWLGSLLLARNRPILHKNIAFKKLLCEGFDTNSLTSVLPFVCKILEKSTASTVFLPPNPWLMGILKVLAELYQFADLTLNLKFEIEVLCNSLNVTLEDIEPSVIIRNHLAQDDIDSQSFGINNEMQRLSLQEPNIIQTVPPATSLTDPNGANAMASLSVQQPHQAPLQRDQENPQASLGSNVGGSSNSNNLQFNDAAYIELANHLVLVGASVFVIHPVLKRHFAVAIEKALQEILVPVVERSVTIASISTSALIMKDFALEPEVQKLRTAAQNVVKHMAGTIALASAKDLLRDSLAANLRLVLMDHGYTDTTMPTDQITIAIDDNTDIICSIVERAAIDRSLSQIEEALQPAFINRKLYAESGTTQPFADQVSTYALQLPEPFRLKVGGLDRQQFAIYEDFGKARSPFEGVSLPEGQLEAQSLPAVQQFNQLQAQPQLPIADGQGLLEGSFDISDQRAIQILEQVLLQIQNAVENLQKMSEESPEQSFKDMASDHRIKLMVTQILNAVDRHALREQLIARTSQITVTLLFACENEFTRDVLSYLLAQLCSLSSNTNKEIIFWLLFSEDQRKFNAPVIISILKSNLVTCSDFDVSLAKQIKGNVNSVIPFSVELITKAVLGPNPYALRSDFAATLDTLGGIDNNNEHYASITKLITLLEKSPEVSQSETTAIQGQTLAEQMNFIFAEWVRLTLHPARNERQFTSFVYQLSQHEILTTPEYAIAFTRISFEFALKYFNRQIPGESRSDSEEPFVALDALAKLLGAIITSSKEDGIKSRLAYSHRLLTVISLVLANHHERDAENFNEQPYFRFFSSFFYEISNLEGDDSEFCAELYILIAEILKTLQPFALPGFSFAWMALISHRYYLPKLLEMPEKRGWSHIIDFLCEILDFEGTYVQGKDFPKAISVLYQGTSRIFLALLHDCPQLFIEYHYVLCKHIPSSFVQIRNLVLSAFPENMELPDPLTQGLKVDRLPEIKEPPVFAVDPSADLKSLGLKKLVDSYVKSPSQSLLKGIASGFKLPSPKKESGLGFDSVTYDSAAFNTFIFYVCIQAVSSDKEKASSKSNNSESNGSEEESSAQFNRDSPYLVLLSNLLLELNVEGRYFLCEAMANQLRYPNRHTHFFSCVILSLFGNYGTSSLGSKKIDIRHLITRVLLERIICNRPHPWGLMITFTELLKNSNYKFWDLPFTKSTPEIERMFGSLYEHISNGSSTNNSNEKSVTTSSTPISN